MFSVGCGREEIRRKQSESWHLQTSSWPQIISVSKLWEERSADLAPSHFSFSEFEPDEKRDILYPLWELVFSDRAKVRRV